jgi:hypothetical protein
MDSNYGTLVRKSISSSDGPILRTTEERITKTGKKFGLRAGTTTKQCKSGTRRQIADTEYDIASDYMVKMGTISAPAIQENISAIQEDISAILEGISTRKKKKVKVKMMDINEANHNMNHMGEAVLRKFLSHHNIKATGKFQNCFSCMKWKGQNKAVSTVATNPAKYQGKRLHIDASGPLLLPMGRKEYWLKIRDEFSGYSWDSFMAEKS